MANPATTATEARDERVGAIVPPINIDARVKRAFSSGPDIARIETGKIVAYAIRVRAKLKVGDRDFGGEINLHEAVMLRRYYEESGGGSVDITPEWVPMLQRLMPLSQEQLQRELARLNDNFVVPRAGGNTLVVPTLYLGTEPAEQLKRLHEVMRKQLDAWSKLVLKASERLGSAKPMDPDYALASAFEAITGKELEEVANIADPGRDGEGGIELPEALMPTSPSAIIPQAQPAPMTPEQAMRMVEGEEAAVDAQQALVQRLVERGGLDQQQAMAVATLHELMDGAIPDDQLAEAIGSKAKVKIDAARRALKG